MAICSVSTTRRCPIYSSSPRGRSVMRSRSSVSSSAGWSLSDIMVSPKLPAATVHFLEQLLRGGDRRAAPQGVLHHPVSFLGLIPHLLYQHLLDLLAHLGGSGRDHRRLWRRALLLWHQTELPDTS